ncbi:thioredoxin family protein [bacterium]|nr:thioredoxin family protein [bacterium]
MATQGFEPGVVEFGMGYEYELSNHAHRGHDVTANPKEEITEFSTTNFELSYTLTPRFRVSGILPFRRIFAPKTDATTHERYIRTFSGVGDAIVAGTWLPYISTQPDRTVLAASAGLRLATGNANPDHYWGRASDLFSRDPVLQPGYGTVDPIFGLSAARKVGRFGTSLSTVMRLSGGTNVYGYRYANEYQGTLGVETGLASWLDAGVSGAVLTSGHDYDTNKKVANTGGLWGYVIPTANFKSAGFTVESSVQIPVYSFVNGGQLISDAIFSVGLRTNLTRTAHTLAGMRGGGAMHMTSAPQNFARAAACPDCGLKHAINQQGLTLVEFMSDECGVCQTFEPTIREFAREHPDLTVRQVDLFSLTQDQLFQYSVEETPTMVLFDADGTPRVRVVGTDLVTIETELKR